MSRRFRFGIPVIPAQSRAECVAYARKAEALGYSSIVFGDHPSFGGLAPFPAFLAAAEATSTLRFGGQAFNAAAMDEQVNWVRQAAGARFDQIVETPQKRRARYGISYITLLDGLVEAFHPVVERLAGS